ncbi:hypothetical protein BT63DRAFT_415627 [Microthyrium microscopicum]|uniref:Uncharacterized protein n=1 Tax=Microthyrium microscopicum TaxID=703497 RepID=A0A6A6U3K1_9PEZI|nr:hypothetical protein BT63DRAFT_415627 [Microthyrium microscopicum]
MAPRTSRFHEPTQEELDKDVRRLFEDQGLKWELDYPIEQCGLHFTRNSEKLLEAIKMLTNVFNDMNSEMKEHIEAVVACDAFQAKYISRETADTAASKAREDAVAGKFNGLDEMVRENRRINSELEQAKANLQTTTADARMTKETLERFRKDLQTLINDNNVAQDNYATLKTDLEQSKRENEKAEAEVTKLLDELSLAKQQINDLETDLDSARADKDLAAKIQQMEIEDMQSQIISHKTAIESLNTQLDQQTLPIYYWPR